MYKNITDYGEIKQKIYNSIFRKNHCDSEKIGQNIRPDNSHVMPIGRRDARIFSCLLVLKARNVQTDKACVISHNACEHC